MSQPRTFALKTLSGSILLSLSVAVIAQAPTTAPSVGSVPAGTVPAATPLPVTPGAPRPFKDIIKGAKETAGFFTVYDKDEKVWISIKPDQFDKPFFFHV